MEKSSAETQLGQVQNQLQQLQQDLSVMQLQFQLMLNTPVAYVPERQQFQFRLSPVKDTALLRMHPSLKLIEQQQQIADAVIELEKVYCFPVYLWDTIIPVLSAWVPITKIIVQETDSVPCN